MHTLLIKIENTGFYMQWGGSGRLSLVSPDMSQFTLTGFFTKDKIIQFHWQASIWSIFL